MAFLPNSSNGQQYIGASKIHNSLWYEFEKSRNVGFVGVLAPSLGAVPVHYWIIRECVWFIEDNMQSDFPTDMRITNALNDWLGNRFMISNVFFFFRMWFFHVCIVNIMTPKRQNLNRKMADRRETVFGVQNTSTSFDSVALDTFDQLTPLIAVQKMIFRSSPNDSRPNRFQFRPI